MQYGRKRNICNSPIGFALYLLLRLLQLFSGFICLHLVSQLDCLLL